MTPGESVSYGYDAESNLEEMVDIHGKITQYEYYHDGRLLSVNYENQLFTYLYDATGRLESMSYPSGTGLVVHFDWDDDGRLLSLDYQKDSLDFQRFEYTYDDSGNRVSMTETDPNSVQVAWTYEYDWLNRLTQVNRNGTPQVSYTYDESDNRKTMTIHGVNEVWDFQTDVGDQLEFIEVSTNGGTPALLESFGYDQDGNLETRTKSGVVTRYVWDTHNRLRQIRVDDVPVDNALYDYGGVRRLKKDGDGVSKAFSSGGMSLAEYRPWGELLPGSFDSVGLALRFVGGYGVRTDLETGLACMRHRWYCPASQRFISRDPIGLSGGANLYAYVENNPVGLVDPEGLDALHWTQSYNEEMAKHYGKFPSLDFDRGSSQSECVRNCITRHQWLPESLEGPARAGLLASGLPIPKSIAGRFGVRVVGIGGTSVSTLTTFPSILSQGIQRMTGVRTPGLRGLGRLASRSLLPLALSDAAIGRHCAKECGVKCDWKDANSWRGSDGRIWNRTGL